MRTPRTQKITGESPAEKGVRDEAEVEVEGKGVKKPGVVGVMDYWKTTMAEKGIWDGKREVEVVREAVMTSAESVGISGSKGSPV